MRRVLLIALVLPLLPVAARAAPSCKSISVTTLAFGNYDVYGTTAVDTVATLSYSCPPPATPTVTIDTGLHGGTAGASRSMQLTTGTDLLGYEVFVDAARTQVWGATPISLPNGNGSTASIYGRLYPGQDVAVGSYSDTLTVTFNF